MLLAYCFVNNAEAGPSLSRGLGGGGVLRIPLQG